MTLLRATTWVLALGAALPASAAPISSAALESGEPVIAVAAEPLAEPAFRAFGEIVSVPEGMEPTIQTGVLRYWGGLAKARIHEEIEFGLMTVRGREHEVAEMDRHLKSPEFLVGLTGDFYLVVAPPSPAGAHHPDSAKVKVFLVKQGQGVVLRQGTWHALPFPVKEEGNFVVAFRDGTAKRDLKTSPFKKQEVVKF